MQKGHGAQPRVVLLLLGGWDGPGDRTTVFHTSPNGSLSPRFPRTWRALRVRTRRLLSRLPLVGLVGSGGGFARCSVLETPQQVVFQDVMWSLTAACAEEEGVAA